MEAFAPLTVLTRDIDAGDLSPEYLQAMRLRAEAVSGSLSAFIEGPLGLSERQRAKLVERFTR